MDDEDKADPVILVFAYSSLAVVALVRLTCLALTIEQRVIVGCRALHAGRLIWLPRCQYLFF